MIGKHTTVFAKDDIYYGYDKYLHKNTLIDSVYLLADMHPEARSTNQRDVEEHLMRMKHNTEVSRTNGKTAIEQLKKMDGTMPKCFCPYFVDVNDDYRCKQCHVLLPGCNKCEYRDTVIPGQTHVNVGWDPMISAFGMYHENTDFRSEPHYIVCTEGD